MRKIMILAREAGEKFEMVISLIIHSCRNPLRKRG
jgi:hypothetical protein